MAGKRECQVSGCALLLLHLLHSNARQFMNCKGTHPEAARRTACGPVRSSVQVDKNVSSFEQRSTAFSQAVSGGPNLCTRSFMMTLLPWRTRLPHGRVLQRSVLAPVHWSASKEAPQGRASQKAQGTWAHWAEREGCIRCEDGVQCCCELEVLHCSG